MRTPRGLLCNECGEALARAPAGCRSSSAAARRSVVSKRPCRAHSRVMARSSVSWPKPARGNRGCYEFLESCRARGIVRERTAGNPFFMEEVVQAQIESGVLVGGCGRFRLQRPVGADAGPASLQSLLAVRIDRLDPRWPSGLPLVRTDITDCRAVAVPIDGTALSALIGGRRGTGVARVDRGTARPQGVCHRTAAIVGKRAQ